MNSVIKKILKKTSVALTPIKSFLEWIFEIEAALSSAWAMASHKRLMMVQWGIPPQPENFDHHIDLFYGWQKSRNPDWTERGVYGCLVLRNKRVLELCCGDGFNARNFYSLTSESIVACDFDPKILRTARRKNGAPNIEFIEADIRTNMPEGTYENIFWNSAIEHFTEDEIEEIMKGIKTRLSPGGIFSGHTIVEKGDGTKQLSHHEYEFKSKEDLLRFFTPYFRNVTVFETICPDRHNLYVWASDGPIPFTSSWKGYCIIQSLQDKKPSSA